MAYVYRHIRLDKNQPFYIGIGKRIQRAYDVKNRNKHWHSIVANSEYRVEILFDDLDYDSAKQKEMELISLYGRNDLGLCTLVNMTDGGEGSVNVIVSEKRKKIASEMAKKRTGVKLSDETRKRISDSKKGVKQSEENILKRKLGIQNSNYKHPEDVIRRIIKTKKERGLPQSKLVLNYSTGVYYNSAIEASNMLSIPLITVYRLCKGQAKSGHHNLKYI